MAYIGNTSTTQAFTPAVDYFNGDAVTVAFTLSRPVASVAQVQAVIENVPQNPGDAFTVSGNTITFTSAPPSGTNNIYVYYTSPITQVIQPGQGTVGTAQLVSGLTVNFADGSASAPSITNDGDSNTGIFFPAADTIAFSEGGAEAMRIDSAGNVGIGTSSPQSPLNVSYSNSSRADCLRLTNTNTGGYGPWINFYGDYSSGYSFAKIGAENESTGGSLRFHTADTSKVSQERMRIDNSGNLLVGTTSSLGVTRMTLNGASGGNWSVGPGNAYNVFYILNSASTGVYVSNGGTSWTANSDERLKTALVPFENAVEKVSSLRAGTGRYLTDDESVSRSFLIAQDVQKVLPEAVDATNPDKLGVQYTEVIPLLVAAIKEQQTIINDLKARIEALENK
jgi:hypothetical protein